MCLVRLSRSRLFPFVDGQVFYFSVGILPSGFAFVLHLVKAYRGCWLDYQWRLQSMANTPMASIAPLKSCRCSPQSRVALMSLSQCTGPTGCVFPAAYRATTRFLLHTTTCASATLPTKSSGTCEAVVRYGVEASLGGVSDRAKRAACLLESVPVSLCFWVSGLVSSLGHVCSPNSQKDPARQKETPPTLV